MMLAAIVTSVASIKVLGPDGTTPRVQVGPGGAAEGVDPDGNPTLELLDADGSVTWSAPCAR